MTMWDELVALQTLNLRVHVQKQLLHCIKSAGRAVLRRYMSFWRLIECMVNSSRKSEMAALVQRRCEENCGDPKVSRLFVEARGYDFFG